MYEPAGRSCARALSVRSSAGSASWGAGGWRSPAWKHVRSPVWHAGPAGSTSASSASPSQSRRSARTCFHNGDTEPPAPHEALPGLERTLTERKRDRPVGSYTVELLDDPPRIGAKVEEEAEEVARAAREETDDRVDEEAADVLYHLVVLLHGRGRTLRDAGEVLLARRR